MGIQEIEILIRGGYLTRAATRAKGLYEPMCGVVITMNLPTGERHRVIAVLIVEDPNRSNEVFIAQPMGKRIQLGAGELRVSDEPLYPPREKKRPRGRGFQRGHTLWKGKSGERKSRSM